MRAVGGSRLFRAGTKESRMTNAKRARGQPDPRAKSRRGVGIKEDVGRLGVHPLLSYKEPPVKNNTALHSTPATTLTAPIPRITAFCAVATRSGAAASLRIATRI